MLIRACEIEYIRKSEDAEARHKRGERQLYCSECGSKWVWPDACQHEGRMTIRQFDACAKKMAKTVTNAYPSERARKAIIRSGNGE